MTAAYENVIITTRSDPEAFPSALRQKRKTQTKHHETGDQGTLVRRLLEQVFLAKHSRIIGVREVPIMWPYGGIFKGNAGT
jgi:hypothetical protein